jgi:hypothetical protein
MNNQNFRIGIIAEDDSDVESAKIMIRRIAGNERLGFKRSIGKGCGKIRRKCHDWAKNLNDKGCSRLVLLHDLDRKNIGELYKAIYSSLQPCPINKFLICIPVEEMEAWFLADPEAISKALNLRKTVKVKGMPEKIMSPKEHIDVLVKRASNNEKEYLNTEHNAKISKYVDFSKLKKCASFVPFFNFIENEIKNV